MVPTLMISKGQIFHHMTSFMGSPLADTTEDETTHNGVNSKWVKRIQYEAGISIYILFGKSCVVFKKPRISQWAVQTNLEHLTEIFAIFRHD